MTSTPYSPTTGIRNWPAYAVGSSGIAAILSALANYTDVFGPTEEGPSDPVWQWLLLIGVSVAIGVGVFATVVRTATPSTADRRGLAIAVVSIPTVVAFWSGLPVILAAAAACLALASGRPSRLGVVTLVIAAAVVGLTAWGCLAG